MTPNLLIGLFLAGSYLLGSCPFGLWVAQWSKGIDIRTQGSGNIGATNVSRVCGPAAGRMVLFLDMVKGLAPPVIGQAVFHFASPWIVLSAMLAIIGHNYSVWLGFKGGKGISTSGGALMGAAPLAGLGVGVIFIVVYGLTWIVSVGSLVAAILLPLLMFWLYPHDPYRLAFGCAAGLMALFKHRKNIQRLRSGTEPKTYLFGKKNPPSAPSSSAETAPSEASSTEAASSSNREGSTDAAR